MSQPRKAKRARTDRTTTRSIWNSTDDWDTLVAESQLSTSSISTRRPAPVGLKSLTRYCAEVAGRAFKRLWELDQGGVLGTSWKYAWNEVPDRLKVPVREEVFKHWGGYLTTVMIAELFIFPPSVDLPAKSLPVIASADRLIPFRPSIGEGYTRVSLRHATKASDTAIAGLIHSMPELEDINLKGCTLAGDRTVDIICKKCKGLKRLNLKGTNVDEMHVREILDLYGKQLEVFKVDRLVIESPDETFIEDSYPNIRKLCLPGDILQSGSPQFRRQSIQSGYTIPWPPAKPTAPGARYRWDTLGSFFPSLTHLSLPGVFLPPLTEFGIKPNTLVKLDFGPGGPPVPIEILSSVVGQHMSTLQHIRFGALALIPAGENLVPLFWTLAQCEKLQSLEIELDGRGREADWMKDWVDWMYLDVMRSGKLSEWEIRQVHPDVERRGEAPRLKRFKINIRSTRPFVPETFDSPGSLFDSPLRETLEELHIPSVNVSDPQGLAKDLAGYQALRILDVSGIGLSEDDVFTLLDGCPNLHTIDLTSCRGIKVQNRRNIFKAWEEARAPSPEDADEEDEANQILGRGGRRKKARR